MEIEITKLRNLRRLGKTVVGGLGDLLKLTNYGKSVITLLKEALDFGGKD